MTETTVDQRGRVLIPEEIRESTGLVGRDSRCGGKAKRQGSHQAASQE